MIHCMYTYVYDDVHMYIFNMLEIISGENTDRHFVLCMYMQKQVQYICSTKCL